MEAYFALSILINIGLGACLYSSYEVEKAAEELRVNMRLNIDAQQDIIKGQNKSIAELTEARDECKRLHVKKEKGK